MLNMDRFALIVVVAIYFCSLAYADERITPRLLIKTSNTTGCTYRRYDSLYFYGPKIRILIHVADHDQCILHCSKTIVGSKSCQAANYIQKTKRCEMMYQKFNTEDFNMVRLYGDLNPASSYLIPIVCIEPTTPKPTRSPNPPAEISKGTCGQTQFDPMSPSKNRIVGGKESVPHSVPWIVSIRVGFSAKRHVCGGTLIRVSDTAEESDIVITAAHCNEDGTEPDMVDVVMGGHDLVNPAEGEQKVEFEKFINHKDYNSTTMENDIAIMKLATPIKFSKTVQPACLPKPGDKLPDETKGLVAGWGNTKEGSSQALKLQQLIVPIVNIQKCTEFYKKDDPPKNLNEKLMMCAGYPEGGKDSCQGDSGGPLTFKGDKGYTLHGVVSFGKGCARVERPGIYARVTTYLNWIDEKVKELSTVAKPSKPDTQNPKPDAPKPQPEPTKPQPEPSKPKPDAPKPNPEPSKPDAQKPDAPKPDLPKGTCGQTQFDPMSPSKNRIVGGKESVPHSLPWIVSIRVGFSSKRHVCGGTLIRVNDKVEESDIVITAAHCNEEGTEPDMVDVVCGGHDLVTPADGEQKVEFEKFINHKDYNFTTMENDIAIMKLATPIKFSNTVQPACLPQASDKLPDDTKGLVAGWGNTKEGSSQALKLQQLIVPIVNTQKCDGFYKQDDPPKRINEKLMMCAGYPEGGKDSCQGDSGGPLTFKLAKGYTLHGVVSFGKGCARVERPGIYARVPNYIDWINEKVKELSTVAKLQG